MPRHAARILDKLDVEFKPRARRSRRQHDCADWNEWDIFLEVLSDQILWDDDFNDADRFLDAAPEKVDFLRHLMAINEDYFIAIPPDPQELDLPRIRCTLGELCRQ